jgi:hypothetical protein
MADAAAAVAEFYREDAVVKRSAEIAGKPGTKVTGASQILVRGVNQERKIEVAILWVTMRLGYA